MTQIKALKNYRVAKLQNRGSPLNLRLYFFISLLLLYSTTPAIGGTDPNRLHVRVQDLPGDPVWVGQQVIISVILSMSERPKGSPRFQIPDVTGGILLKVAGRPVYGSEERDGTQFTTWLYSFSFYPHRSGQHTIPSISVRVNLPEGDGTWRQLKSRTDPFTIRSRLPPGAKGLAMLVTTSKMEVKEKWNPVLKAVKVGDAITRTVTMRAPDILGMGFPSLSFTASEGVAVYPKPPKVNDKSYRGDITGERTETVVYVCEREGRITLPGLIIPWFDLKTEELKRVTLPARHFEVTPNPAFKDKAEKDPEAVDEIPWQKLWVGLMLLMTATAGGVFAMRRLYSPARDWVRRCLVRIKVSEPFLFRRLASAVKAGDAKAVINRATPWLNRLFTSIDAPTLSALAGRSGDEGFQASVKALMQHRFGRQRAAMTSEPWRDPSFLKGLARVRKRCLKKAKPAHRNLPPLNPQPRIKTTRV